MPVLDKHWLQTCDGWLTENKVSRHIHQNKDSENLMHVEENDTSTTDRSENSYNLNYKLLILKSNVPSKNCAKNSMQQQKRYSPKDHRNISIISYFSYLQDLNLTYFQSIHHIRPYRVSWSKFALHVAHAKVEYNQLLKVFNASLIGLCQVDVKYVI
jgi:hypothetical protein